MGQEDRRLAVMLLIASSVTFRPLRSVHAHVFSFGLLCQVAHADAGRMLATEFFLLSAFNYAP